MKRLPHTTDAIQRSRTPSVLIVLVVLWATWLTSDDDADRDTYQKNEKRSEVTK